MKFLLLLYGDEAAEADLPVSEQRRIIDEHEEFGDQLRDDGVHLFSAALDQSSAATTVRDDATAEGPFAGGDAQLGAVYAIQCADTEQALAYAEQVPKGPGLAVEVRPLLDL